MHLSPLERDRLRSVVIEALERAFWAGSELAQGYDALAEADIILAEMARGGGR